MLDGREVDFAATAGTVVPARATIADGEATTQFSSATPAGVATLSAELDAATATGAVFVGEPARIASATLTGPGKIGEPLTCAAQTVTGTPGPGTAFAWLRAGVPIAGTTGNTYVPVEGDVGTAISCRVTATNEFGSAAAARRSRSPPSAAARARAPGDRAE